MRGGRGERARDDDLGRGIGGVPLREAGRIRVASCVEVGMRLVDAVVDDSDLDALAGGGEAGAPERRRADQGRAGVRGRFRGRGGHVAERVIGDCRPDGRAGERAQACQVGGGEHDRDAVECDAVVPVDVGCRNRDGQSGCERALRRRQSAQVRDRSRRAQRERMAPSRGRRECPVAGDLDGEGRARQRDDHLDQIRRATRRRCCSSAREQRESGSRASASGSRTRFKRAAWYVRARRFGCPQSGYTDAPRGCGGIGRRARFRSVWASARGGSSPLIRIARSGRLWRLPVADDLMPL